MVELKVNVCPEERMMCYDAEGLKKIVFYFCETGEMNLNITGLKISLNSNF